MKLPESRICGNCYDKVDKENFLLQDYKDVESTVYFDVDRVVFMDKKYFQNNDLEEINNWKDVFN